MTTLSGLLVISTLGTVMTLVACGSLAQAPASGRR
jgi:hypothetical protein